MEDCYFGASRCEDKLCKPSYKWCPSCDKDLPRRRSKSDEPYRRRSSRDVKMAGTRRSPRSQEYENMEFLKVKPQHEYFLPDRIQRSNLVELPTSYITNNHQTPNSGIADSTDDKRRKMKKEDLLEVLQQFETTTATYLRKSSETMAALPRPVIKFENPFVEHRVPMGFQERYAAEVRVMRDRIASIRESTRLKETAKKKNLINNTVEPAEVMQEKLQRWKVQSQVQLKERGDSSPPLMTVKPMQVRENRAKKVAIKTKVAARMNSGANRLKKNRSRKSMVTLSTSSDSDDCSASDNDECTDLPNNDEEESENEDLTPSPLSSETETSVPHPQPGSGDSSAWPIRQSLFPHIPPYISFNVYDAETAYNVPGGRRLLKWKLSTITPLLVRKTLVNTGFILVRKSNQWLGTWGKHMKSPMFKTLKDNQKMNHFPGTFQLGRKDRLWRNFQRMMHTYGYREFGFLPQTYVLPQELKLLKQNWEYKNGSRGETWIIKPPASARGVGIKVINKWAHLPKKVALVVQKYISNPYLINGSKFDLRLYVLVTSMNPLRIYLYPEGLARFASAKYSEDEKDLKDRYMHLTNYSINKLSSQYTANEDANACQGHKWTLTKLFEYMEQVDGIDTEALWKTLQQLVIKTFIAAESPIIQLCEENIGNMYNCYELFGLDFLLDVNLKPWLLEVNISPSLHSSSPLDAFVKGPMVQTLFNLAQFHLPQRLGQTVRESPQCHEPKLYLPNLTKKEMQKHEKFLEYEKRDYLDDILVSLTGDDVRQLTRAEDEYTVKGRFERIFPTAHTHKYLNFMEPRYYNRLFDAWETRQENNRRPGIALLQSLCAHKVHLKVASQSNLHKNLPNTILGDANLAPSKENPNRPLSEAMQEVSIQGP